MNKKNILSLVLLAMGSVAFAQDIESAKKAIDAEQFEKAKSILKSMVKANPANGKANFLLGNVYLRQNIQDSARAVFQNGLTAKENGAFNYIGLGQLDLDNNNAQAAQFNFDQAVAGMKKKDIEQLVYIGQAYTQSDNPNYKKAIEVLNKAKAVSLNDPSMLIALGDAYFGDKNQNEAYASYRNAFDVNKNLRAKTQLGVLLKSSRQFAEAKKAFDEVIALDATYAPAYRELAQNHYSWALNDSKNFKTHTADALQAYEKYMSLTDNSVSSKIRYAEFVYLAKDYPKLEKITSELRSKAKNNYQVNRLFGFSAYENGNNDAAIESINQYINRKDIKLVGRDYLYLGLAQLKKSTPTVAEGQTPKVDDALYQSAVANFKKAVELDKPMANDLNEIGKGYFDKKMYKYAAGIFEVATSNPNSKNYLYDNFFLGYALYFDNFDKDAKLMNQADLKKAEQAFANVTVASPTTQDAHIYRARVNALLTEATAKEQMAKSFEEFTKVVTTKGGDTLEKNKSKMVECYNELARYYGKTDKVKAADFVAKALALDPADADALNLQKSLK